VFFCHQKTSKENYKRIYLIDTNIRVYFSRNSKKNPFSPVSWYDEYEA
jgi:hypothetical protein